MTSHSHPVPGSPTPCTTNSPPAPPASASSASAMSACRWPSSSRAPDSTTTGIDLDTRKVDAINRGESYIPGRADGRRGRVSSTPAGCRPRPTPRSIADARHHQHLRADAAAQDQGPRPVLRRLGRRDDRGAPAARPARDPRVDDLSGYDGRSRAADSRAQRPHGRDRTSSSRSRPSASIPATRSGRRGTCRRSSAA